MRLTVKLYASLGQYLPSGAKDNVAQIDVADGITPIEVIRSLGIPSEHCHLVLVNGIFVSPSQRDKQALAENDALAIWPPVAGG